LTPDIILIRVNCPDEKVALAIGETAVQNKLSACVNIDGPIQSIYVWEGELEREEEWILWIKAPSSNWSPIEALVKDHHPHEIPAILAIPCVNSNQRYAEWLEESTKS